jgi:prepilin-type N-terminal cleavage/methylation domain-containing protein
MKSIILKRKSDKGFTLLEVLLVVAIIAILAGIVILAINPTKQLADARNSQRRVDVNTILNAVYQYAVDTNNIPATITTTATEVCKTGGTCTGLIDLSVLTASEKYVVSMPIAPQCASANGTCYTIIKTANNRVTVTASNAENGATISVTR